MYTREAITTNKDSKHFCHLEQFLVSICNLVHLPHPQATSHLFSVTTD